MTAASDLKRMRSSFGCCEGEARDIDACVLARRNETARRRVAIVLEISRGTLGPGMP